MSSKNTRTATLRRLAWGGLFSVAVLAAANTGRAEPTAQDRSLAEALFRDAKALVDAEKYDEACPKLEESHRLDPKPGTMLNLAVCQDKRGKTASAWSDYLEAAALAARAGQKDREAFARDRAAALEAELSRLRITVTPGTPGLVVKLDGTVLNPAAWGTAAAIDPGDHVVEASAPGFSNFSEKVAISRGASTRDLTVPKLSPEAGGKTETNTPPTGSTEEKPPSGETNGPVAPPPSSPNAMLYAGIGASAVGLAGIVVGSIFGAKTLSLRDEAACVDVPAGDAVRCTPEGAALYEDAKSASTVSTIGFGVGVVGIGAGVALLMASRSGKTAPSRPQSAFVLPVVGRSAAGVQAGFSF